jgi:hypothetical protein
MTDLQARLDALPEWPEPCSNAVRLGEVCSDCSNCFDVAHETAAAALARLALWHELAQAGDVRLVRHADDCLAGVVGGKCSCGRDRLLQKLEVPRG